MAWRIDKSVIRGEIDNRVQNRVTGRIWFVGLDAPVELDLTGNPWRDLAGHVIKFTNPNPKTGKLDGFAAAQDGRVGDMTASRKVKVPEIPIEEVMRLAKAGKKWPWHWANSLYLEWFSERNGRVVIESTDFTIEIDSEAAWVMDEEIERQQHEENATSMVDFMNLLGRAVANHDSADDDPEHDDEPQSRSEAEAEAEAAYMDKLLDRVEARIEREKNVENIDFEKIHEEEREQLRREMGLPPDPEPTPEQEEEDRRRIEEMNAAAEEAMRELEAEKWKGPKERKRPELVARAFEFGLRLHDQIEPLLPTNPPQEHPLIEMASGIQIASAKLAGALGNEEDEEDWPPDPVFAGNTLVRLKKARSALRDARYGLDSADEEQLGPQSWRVETRREIQTLLDRVQQLIDEVRHLLNEDDA